MSHENSITVQAPSGKWVNISGNVGGKFNPRKAEALFRAGKVKPLGGASFNSAQDAVDAAEARSKTFAPKPLIDILNRR